MLEMRAFRAFPPLCYFFEFSRWWKASHREQQCALRVVLCHPKKRRRGALFIPRGPGSALVATGVGGARGGARRGGLRPQMCFWGNPKFSPWGRGRGCTHTAIARRTFSVHHRHTTIIVSPSPRTPPPKFFPHFSLIFFSSSKLSSHRAARHLRYPSIPTQSPPHRNRSS